MEEYLKVSELKKVLKRVIKEYASINGYFLKGGYIFKRIGDIIQGVCFDIYKAGKIKTNIFVRPMYHDPEYDFFHEFSWEIDRDDPDNWTILLGRELSSVEMTEEHLQKIIDFYENFGVPWLERLNSPEKILLYLEDKSPSVNGTYLNGNNIKAMTNLYLKKYNVAEEHLKIERDRYIEWIKSLGKDVEEFHINKLSELEELIRMISAKEYDKIEKYIKDTVAEVARKIKIN